MSIFDNNVSVIVFAAKRGASALFQLRRQLIVDVVVRSLSKISPEAAAFAQVPAERRQPFTEIKSAARALLPVHQQVRLQTPLVAVFVGAALAEVRSEVALVFQVGGRTLLDVGRSTYLCRVMSDVDGAQQSEQADR